MQLNFDNYLMPYCVAFFDLTWPQSDNPFLKQVFKQGVQNLKLFFFYVFSPLVSRVSIPIELKTLKSF